MDLPSSAPTDLLPRRRRIVPIALALGVAALAGGCSAAAERLVEEAAERAIEADSGEEVELDLGEGRVEVRSDDGDLVIDADEGEMTIEGADGDASFHAGEGVPEGWPADLPVPDGLSEVQGASVSDGTQSGFSLSGTTDASPGDLVDDYAGRLVDAGWAEIATHRPDDALASATFRAGEVSVNVTASSTVTGSGTQVVVTVAD